jgi:hypothetical protein
MNAPRTLAEQLADAADRPGPDLAAPAFLVARLEYKNLDPGPYLDQLDVWVKRRFIVLLPIPATTRRLPRA